MVNKHTLNTLTVLCYTAPLLFRSIVLYLYQCSTIVQAELGSVVGILKLVVVGYQSADVIRVDGHLPLAPGCDQRVVVGHSHCPLVNSLLLSLLTVPLSLKW